MFQKSISELMKKLQRTLNFTHVLHKQRFTAGNHFELEENFYKFKYF